MYIVIGTNEYGSEFSCEGVTIREAFEKLKECVEGDGYTITSTRWFRAEPINVKMIVDFQEV